MQAIGIEQRDKAFRVFLGICGKRSADAKTDFRGQGQVALPAVMDKDCPATSEVGFKEWKGPIGNGPTSAPSNGGLEGVEADWDHRDRDHRWLGAAQHGRRRTCT